MRRSNIKNVTRNRGGPKTNKEEAKRKDEKDNKKRPIE
jgi:hypothetical protein